MDLLDTQQTVIDLLLSIRSRRIQSPAFANDTRWAIALFVLESSDLGKTIDISGLAHVIGKARNTIAFQVSALEEAGYLISTADKNDQRRKIVAPTETLKTEFENLTKSITSDITKASYKIQLSITR